MKRSTFISLFIGTHLLLVVLQVYKHSKHAQLLYDKQKQESRKTNLLARRQQLTQELYACKDRAAVKEFAVKQLHMEPIRLSQIKKLSVADVLHNEQNI